MKTNRLLWLLPIALAVGCAGRLHAQSVSHFSSVMGNGGGFASDSTHRLFGTLGQPVVGVAQDGGQVLSAGFWFPSQGFVTSVSEPGEGVPLDFFLSQNYPNPFNPTTVISAQWPEASEVTLKVMDILGREVSTVAEGSFPPGRYSFAFDASRLASGVYFYRLEAKGSSGLSAAVKKMILLR